jgi:hypothetical protein
MIFYLGNKVTNLVDTKTKVLRNKAKSWVYGYDPTIEVIIISKDGTLGDIYNIQGINIGLPAVPERKDIINHNKTSANQKFVREELPEGLNEETQYQSKYIDFISEQFKNRTDGIWVYIKGKPIWLTGTYWFGIQWCREEQEFAKFRVIQNELMIYWEACKADKRSFGMIYVKNRRIGASFLALVELLEAGTITEDKILGIVSKTGKDSSNIFKRLIKCFKRLPCFFQPQWDGTNTPKKELVLDVPTKRRAKNEVIEEDGLGSVIAWHNTASNSMDGDAIYRSLLDESGKYPKDVPFDKYWYVVKTGHSKGIRITGKSMVVSTVNAKKDGGAEYEKIWKDSSFENTDASGKKVSGRDANGQTKSGLYPIMIPARYCLEGMFDLWGFSIIENPKEPIMTDEGIFTEIGSLTWIANKKESLKDDPENLNEFLRQFPDSVRDAFREEGSDCSFNLMKIVEQMDYNENELEDFATERGNFVWKGGIQDSEVIWQPNEKGRFWIANGCHPPEEYRNKKELKFFNGVQSWAPIAGHIGCIGIDPYNRSKTVDSRGSQGAAHLSTKYNTSHLPNQAFIAEYIDRPKTIELFFEDMIMFALYYSVPFLCELSNERFLATVKKRGYRHFSMNNPFKLFKDLNPTEKEFGGAPPQDAKIGEQQFFAIETYIEDHIGVARESNNRSMGDIGYMPFNRTLEQWKDVDPNNRTKYDAYISSSLSLLGNQRINLVNKTTTRKRELVFDTFDNSGTFSNRQ